jgi:hypothetical protein
VQATNSPPLPQADLGRSRALRRPHRGVWALGALLLALAGCGYVMSGTWDDDPGNWKRAFHSDPPPGLEVTHSQYWRAPHFTFEFGYHFEVEVSEAVRKELFERNRYVQLTDEEARRAKADGSGNRPAWFTPEPVERYEVWVPEEPLDGNFRLFVDRDSGTLFLADYQY